MAAIFREGATPGEREPEGHDADTLERVGKRRKQPLPQTIGGIMFGFEQQVLRSIPPPHELVHHARPDDPVPAADGTLLSIRIPVLDVDAGEAHGDQRDRGDGERGARAARE